MHDLWLTQPIPRVAAPPEPPPDPASMHRVAAIGLVLVGYSYLAALWPVRHGETPGVVLIVREWLNFPLGVGGDFGLLGIGLLLLAGGYWAAGMLTGGHGGRLAWLAVARGYLPYALACTIGFLLLLGAAEPLTRPRRVDPTAGGYPTNLLLVDRLAGEGALVGVGWAVAVAGCFAVLLAITAVLLRRGPMAVWLGAVGQLAVVAAVNVTAAGAGGWYHQLGVLAGFCVFPLLGELVWLARSTRAGWLAAPLCAGCLAVLIAAERTYPQLGVDWFPLTLVYTLLIALLAIKGGPPSRVTTWLGARAYAGSLLVCVIGYPLLSALHKVDVPFWLGLPLATAVTLLIADIVHRLTAVLAR